MLSSPGGATVDEGFVTPQMGVGEVKSITFAKLNN